MASSSARSNLAAPVSLLDTLKSIENGTISAADSIAACQGRIASHEHKIKAFAYLDQTVQPTDSGPLNGICFATKDIFDTATLPTCHNSPIYADHMAGRDAAMVAMAKAAGATLLGKSVTTEFAFFEPGPTRNPHNLDHTPGGSSSGSAAAVAAGMVHWAIGSQTGGSIVRPAAFCGITGYKPSAGLLPKTGMKDFSWSLDTVGLFTKTVADVAYLTSVLTGRNLKISPTSNLDKPRLGIVRSHTWLDADEDYRAMFEDLLSQLERYGAILSDIEPSDNNIAAFHSHQVIQDFEARQALAWEYTRHPDLLSPLLKQTLDFAQTIKPSDYDDARVCAERASAELDDYFEDIDAIITLSAPGPAPKGLASTGSSIFNRIWTLFGLPSVNVAGLHHANGLPLGVQIVGPYMADHTTLEIAHWLEGAIERYIDR